MVEKHQLLEEIMLYQKQEADERKAYRLETKEAHIRNQSILQDLQIAEDRFKQMERSSPHPTVIHLEEHYWEFVEEELPKWEQFLLGKTSSPFGMKKKQQSRQKCINSQTMHLPKEVKVSTLGSKLKTFPM
ncbi:centrosomal protein 15 isoform X2 [Pelobates fuscus]